MELLLYLLLPFIWLFMAAEWIYNLLRSFFYWLFPEQKPRTKRTDDLPPDDPPKPKPPETQRQEVTAPERNRTDSGMAPQERTLPQIIPIPGSEQNPAPVKEEPLPEFVFEPPKRGKTARLKTNDKKKQEQENHKRRSGCFAWCFLVQAFPVKRSWNR